jgi:hypothetical protein
MTKLEKKQSGLLDIISRDHASKSLRKAYWALLIFQCTLIILFASCSGIKAMDSAEMAGTISQGYGFFIGIEIMM